MHSSIRFDFFADDLQLFVHLSHKNVSTHSTAFEKSNNCLINVKNWIPSNKLNLSPNKTELVLFGSKSDR